MIKCPGAILVLSRNVSSMVTVQAACGPRYQMTEGYEDQHKIQRVLSMAKGAVFLGNDSVCD